MVTEVATPRYLLDVNLLIALALPRHVHHARAHDWFASVDAWATTPFTEAAFVRLLTNHSVVGIEVPMSLALHMLGRLHEDDGHAFASDTASLATPQVSFERLTSSRDVTDVHLVDLAARSGHVLATLDRGIPELLAERDRRHVLVIP